MGKAEDAVNGRAAAERAANQHKEGVAQHRLWPQLQAAIPAAVKNLEHHEFPRGITLYGSERGTEVRDGESYVSYTLYSDYSDWTPTSVQGRLEFLPSLGIVLHDHRSVLSETSPAFFLGAALTALNKIADSDFGAAERKNEKEKKRRDEKRRRRQQGWFSRLFL